MTVCQLDLIWNDENKKKTRPKIGRVWSLEGSMQRLVGVDRGQRLLTLGGFLGGERGFALTLLAEVLLDRFAALFVGLDDDDDLADQLVREANVRLEPTNAVDLAVQD